MREPYVFPMSESPFATDVTPIEQQQRVLDVGADVITDELGAVVAFMSEDDVDGILNDTRFASVALPTLHLSGVEDGPLWDLWTHLMFAKDAEDHRRIRGVVIREFAPKRVERLRAELEQAANELCDAVPAGAGFDLWVEFARPFAARAACALVGIPADDADRAADWAFDLARAFFPFMSPDRRARAERSAVELLRYMDALLTERREEPADDLMTLLAGGETTHDLTAEEVLALAANMVFAGLEATAKALTTGIYYLVLHGQLDALAAHPESIPGAVLEVLRFAPPARHVGRYVPQDMVCQDVALRAGQVVSANIAGACRDPRRYANPDELDITRHAPKQLAFGAGPHYCLGASLAKLAMEVGFATLSSRFPTLRLAGEDGDVEWDYEGFAGVVRLDCRI
jgi:cytochrome P450